MDCRWTEQELDHYSDYYSGPRISFAPDKNQVVVAAVVADSAEIVPRQLRHQRRVQRMARTVLGSVERSNLDLEMYRKRDNKIKIENYIIVNFIITAIRGSCSPCRHDIYNLYCYSFPTHFIGKIAWTLRQIYISCLSYKRTYQVNSLVVSVARGLGLN